MIEKYGFSEKQAEAIVMLQLYRLTNTDIVTLENENKELDNRIAYLNNILKLYFPYSILCQLIINSLRLKR